MSWCGGWWGFGLLYVEFTDNKKNVLWVGYLNTTTGSYQETLNFKESVVAQRERENLRLGGGGVVE